MAKYVWCRNVLMHDGLFLDSSPSQLRPGWIIPRGEARLVRQTWRVLSALRENPPTLQRLTEREVLELVVTPAITERAYQAHKERLLRLCGTIEEVLVAKSTPGAEWLDSRHETRNSRRVRSVLKQFHQSGERVFVFPMLLPPP